MKNDNLFDKLFRRISGKASTAEKIWYQEQGPSGYVWYQDPGAKFSLYYEFCGNECIVGINIPAPEDWERHTGLPLARRDEVLQFIGRQVVKDKTTGGFGSFRIEGKFLNIYA